MKKSRKLLSLFLSVIMLTLISQPALTISARIANDITNDGIVDIFDILAIQNFLLGKEVFSTEVKTVADGTGDGTIDIFDILNIQKALLNDTGNTTPTIDTSDGTVVTTFSGLLSAITDAQNKGGGKVYVTGTSIACTSQIALSKANANDVSIIGVPNIDGTYPVLNFNSMRTAYTGVASSDSQVGVRISGSKYTIKNLIIEKAADNGIQIKGATAGYNTIENCITRYNNDAGIQITAGANHNTIRFVYSYRNCDVYSLGGNADGFAPKLNAATGNTFYGCYAWDNSDDGWDSYDKVSTELTTDLTYQECATWNNGNPKVFTGQYDYENGKPLDTNLFLIEQITKQDSSFATNYANKAFALPTTSFITTSAGTFSPANWVVNYNGNSNGFKFGSYLTTSATVRTVINCLAFGHTSKGFDNNNGASTASFTNTVAFDNKYNYYFPPFTITGFTNVLGFSGGSSNNIPSGLTVTTPIASKQATIRSTVTSTVNTIVTKCQSNIIPGETYFNIYQ